MRAVADFLWGLLLGVAFVLVCTVLIQESRSSQVDVQGLLKQTVGFTAHGSIGGTAFVAKGPSGQAYLLTNWHVCYFSKNHGNLQVIMEDGSVIPGKVVATNSVADLCAVKIDYRGPALTLAPRVGPSETVHTRGYPHGHLARSSGTIRSTEGVPMVFGSDEVSRCPIGWVTHPQPKKEFFCTSKILLSFSSLYVEPGASGSPVVNDRGELVGVIEGQRHDNVYDGGFVPLAVLKDFMKSL